MAAQETTSFKGVKVVVRLAQYGSRLCFHIDPGDGSTLPIYLDPETGDRLVKKIQRLETGPLDIVVVEKPSDSRKYLKRIKESKNARN